MRLKDCYLVCLPVVVDVLFYLLVYNSTDILTESCEEAVETTML